MYLRCSSVVVAPMHCKSPRERAGLKRLETSRPAPPERPTDPAPTSTCISSIIKMTLPSAAFTSASRLVTRVSSSPRSFAPAMSSPTSRESTRLPLRNSGHSSSTMRRARPSAMAVLPTPGSPNRMGLFFWRRARICMTRATSRSRPMTGSVAPSSARAVRSTQKSRSAVDSAPAPAPAPARAAPALAPAPAAAPALPCSFSCSPRRRRIASFFTVSLLTPCLLRMLVTPPSSATSSARAMCSGAR
mmetsp:Transcript_30002/g.57628  ORF Transcript_30002/g.57628 Transcript_30002/m.57628 type:complete len:246 (+) Transcript_30002:1709-2446(+)